MSSLAAPVVTPVDETGPNPDLRSSAARIRIQPGSPTSPSRVLPHHGGAAGTMIRMKPVQPDITAKVTIRARIMWAMVLLTLASLATSGAIVAIVQDRAISDNLVTQLERARDELRLLSDEGIDPATGAPFSGPAQLLETYLARTVIGEGEGELAFLGSDVALVASEDVPLRPEDDDELIDAVRPWVSGTQMRIEPVRTNGGNYHVLVAPVRYPDAYGALLHVFDRQVAEAELRRTMTVYAIVAVGTLAVVVFAAWLVVGRLLRPIEELRRAAEAIDERDLTTRVPVRGKDDLSALSATINRMLDRVQRSVEGQRQLLDDVGHELRTPITVVRGHMELIDVADPADVAQTRDLAIDEMDRMSVLVNDLLMLAKSTESDFVQPQWFELATLTDQVLEKARALGDRAWRLERVAAAEAWLDPGRVTQAWLQLAANAVKYSGVGSPITLGSRLHRGEVELWVSDQGIGIAPDQLETVRERFGRTREAASRAAGAGLGLTIVESIVAPHDGRLLIDSVEGQGSTFTIVLPIRPQEETA